MLDSVKNQLHARRGNWVRIAKETELTYPWLTRMMQGRIPDPSVRKIQRLANYFDAHRCDYQKEKAHDSE